MKPHYWDKAVIYLSQKDTVLAKLIENYSDQHLIKSLDPFHTIIRAIIGQQISVKAAMKIWERLQERITPLTAENILLSEEILLKEIGLSYQKINYFKNIAKFFCEPNFNLEEFLLFEEEIIASELIKIKGVGRWTAEMFLMFHLSSPDILPLADIGLIKAIENNYNSSMKMTKDQIFTVSEIWRPYRTVATWYLWCSLDPFVINY
ncbi:MAG: DNA-3-methyladenine glycosylase family protein [Alphaproteobacteria bacterium]